MSVFGRLEFKQSAAQRKKSNKRQANVFSRFSSDQSGAIAIMFAMSITILLAMVGGGVDYARWLSAKSKTLNAMDASVLAAGRILQLPGNTDNDAVNAANQYYSKNKADTLAVDNTTFSVSGNEITGTTNSTVETPFLNVIGIGTLPVKLTAKAVLAADANAGSHVEVSLMLDTTGSMSGSKMTDLKAAARDLVDIVVWDDQSNFTSRIALAPFSRYVNVGTTYFNAVTGATASGNPNQRTCVKERSTSDRYTDAAPGSGNYFNYYTGSNTCQPTSTIMPLSSDKQALKDHINAMPTTGMTAGHLGTAWAWYLISPNWSSVWPTSSVPHSYSLMSQNADPNSSASPGEEGFKPKLYKIAVLMTDGSYNKYYSGSNSTTQARAICTEIKDSGVTVYTVGFQIGVGSEPDVTMQQCATSSSHYYNASSGEALKQAFRDIAIKISDLRISE